MREKLFTSQEISQALNRMERPDKVFFGTYTMEFEYENERENQPLKEMLALKESCTIHEEGNKVILIKHFNPIVKRSDNK